MVTGISIDRANIPANQSESAFGIWLYEEAMVFSTSNSKNILSELVKASDYLNIVEPVAPASKVQRMYRGQPVD